MKTNPLEFPTADAYEAVCKAYWAWRDEAKRLHEKMKEIYDFGEGLTQCRESGDRVIGHRLMDISRDARGQ